MTMTRKPRRFVALLAIASLSFMQVAVAAFACPGPSAPVAAVVTQGESGCEEMDQAQSNLCHEHCLQQAQSIEKPVGLSVPPAPLTGLHAAPIPLVTASYVSANDQRSILARATAPPITVRNCCLRV